MTNEKFFPPLFRAKRRATKSKAICVKKKRFLCSDLFPLCGLCQPVQSRVGVLGRHLLLLLLLLLRQRPLRLQVPRQGQAGPAAGRQVMLLVLVLLQQPVLLVRRQVHHACRCVGGGEGGPLLLLSANVG